MPIIVIPGTWMPNLAAVTVTGVLADREGIQQLLGKFFNPCLEFTECRIIQ